MRENQQQAFDINWRHFVEEGGQPSATNTRCLFYTSDDCRCSLGLLIDKQTARTWDTNYLSSYFGFLVRRDAEARAMAIKYGFEFLSDLQNVHDNASFDANFAGRIKINLIDLAAKYHLKIPD